MRLAACSAKSAGILRVYMEKDARILVAGEGHLSFQVGRKLKEKGYAPVHIETHTKANVVGLRDESSVYEHYQRKFEQAGIQDAEMVYLIDDEDKLNIQFFLIASALNPKVRLVMSLFNDTLAPHLRAGHSKLEVLNPASIAAAEFAAAALKKPKKTSRVVAAPAVYEHADQSLRNALVGISGIFFAIFCVSVTVFHTSHHLSWLDAVYFTTTVITTTGFGDITLLNATPLVKVFGIALMFVGVSFVSVAFSLIVEWLLSRRAELALGRKQYTLRGHVILCGLGRLGYQVTLVLLKQGYEVLVIENDPDNRFIDLVRGSGAEVFIADASLSRNLRRANISQAKSLL